jgi:hypothetical protein
MQIGEIVRCPNHLTPARGIIIRLATRVENGYEVRITNTKSSYHKEDDIVIWVLDGRSRSVRPSIRDAERRLVNRLRADAFLKEWGI